VLSPKIRRGARERALQFLFGLDFTEYDWEGSLESFWATCASRPGVRKYAESLVRGVMENLEDLDAAIGKAAENWAPDRIGRIERNILRVALFEMRHGEDVPTTVAINEAVEVAKRFGAEEAPRFVNGVLDRLRKE
jgi:N utilization substance protein B